jgi:hypothetical protein
MALSWLETLSWLLEISTLSFWFCSDDFLKEMPVSAVKEAAATFDVDLKCVFVTDD